MKALRWMGRGARAALTLTLAALLACNVYLIAARRWFGVENPTVFGFTAAVVVSGSMAPALEVGTLILIRAQDSYGPGDIVTFRSGSSLVTHRIVSAVSEGFVTRGDANHTSDPEAVALDDIVGKVVWQSLAVGLAVGYIRTPAGMVSLGLLGALLLALWAMPRRPRPSEEDGDGA